MWELVTILIALPLLYLIGDFYGRLGAWCWRAAMIAWEVGIEVYSSPRRRGAGSGGQRHAG